MQDTSTGGVCGDPADFAGIDWEAARKENIEWRNTNIAEWRKLFGESDAEVKVAFKHLKEYEAGNRDPLPVPRCCRKEFTLL